MAMIQKIYLGGSFIETDQTISVINPYTLQSAEQCFAATKEIYNQAIILAGDAKRSMAALSSYERYTILQAIAQHLQQREKEVAQLISMESGKPMRYSIAEVRRAAETFTVAAEEAKRLPKEYISLDWTPTGKSKEGIIKWFPVGIVAGISPFNFPLNLVAHKIAPAIAAGCPIILKPASQTPLTALLLAEIINQTNLPKGGVSILPGPREAGMTLVNDDRINLLSFTGSDQVGWRLKSSAGKKKVILELGGNAAVYIHADADIQRAVAACFVGGFAYSGQICIHVQRIYVHKSVGDEFTQAFIQHTKKLKNGDPLSEETAFSVMIDEENAIRAEAWIQEAVNDGAKILHGGHRTKNYLEPTILTNTQLNQKVIAEEIFAPVVCIEAVNDHQEAIEKINNSRYGLQAGIFTTNHAIIQDCFSQLEVGGVVLNDAPTWRADHMPYGGVKDSGLGREGVKYAIQEMMEARILVQ